MTRHKHAQTGLGIPSPLDRWINAMLRVLAMLVLNVASTIWMRLRRPAVNATRQMPQPLPGLKTDTQQQETNIAVPQDSPTSAHAEQRIADARPSKHERVLTTLEAELQLRVPREGGDPVHSRKARAKRSEPLRALSGPTPSQAMRLLNQSATNKSVAT